MRLDSPGGSLVDVARCCSDADIGRVAATAVDHDDDDDDDDGDGVAVWCELCPYFTVVLFLFR